MKIINRYVLKEHLGPFLFASSTLTSFMLLQVIARKFGDLVGRGLSWQTITEFFVLSLPYTVALTLPMAVLVAVLYAFSRLAAENEITALKAGGVSARALLKPALGAATVVAIIMLWFNDQVLSRANHELATLQIAILRTKPTFALKEQVINPVKEGQLYLRAGHIEQDQSGRMRDVTIYDVSDAARRRTIFADSGTLLFAENHRDLVLRLYRGWVMSAPSAAPGQLDRIYYQQDVLKIRDVANSFQSIDADTASKGEREMTVCEMQKQLETRTAAFQQAYTDSLRANWRSLRERGQPAGPEPTEPKPAKAGGIGALYCRFITKYLHVPEAQAAELTPAMRMAAMPPQDTSKKKAGKSDSVMVLIGTILKKVPRDKIPPGAYIPETAGKSNVPPAASVPVPPVQTVRPPVNVPVQTPTPQPAVQPPAPPASNPELSPSAAAARSAGANATAVEVADAKVRLDEARYWRNRYGVEIEKKFSLAAACIVFVLVGAPIALRFPRAGIGLVMGIGLVVFAIYYVGLNGGEALANQGYITPFWAMWADNIIFALVGLALITRMGNEGVTGRGGNFGELVESVRGWFTRRREERTPAVAHGDASS